METDLLLAVLVVVLGSIIQGVSGVGGGFIMVPLLAMINMKYLPGPGVNVHTLIFVPRTLFFWPLSRALPWVPGCCRG